GIRDFHVTGVQTCALPIYAALIDFALFKNRAYSASVFSNFLLNGCIGTMMIASIWLQQGHHLSPLQTGMMTLGYLVTVLAMIRRSEERRVGTERGDWERMT